MLLVIDYWLLVTGYWLLVTSYLSLFLGDLFMVDCPPSTVKAQP